LRFALNDFFLKKRVEGGELFDKVVELGQYDEKTAKLLFFQMVRAIKVGFTGNYFQFL
jgi:hypothetical protein